MNTNSSSKLKSFLDGMEAYNIKKQLKIEEIEWITNIMSEGLLFEHSMDIKSTYAGIKLFYADILLREWKYDKPYMECYFESNDKKHIPIETVKLFKHFCIPQKDNKVLPRYNSPIFGRCNRWGL